MIVVLPEIKPLSGGEEVYELSSGSISSATPRVLTYSTKDVIDKRISIPAQHSLVRLSKNPATSADAVGMLEDVKAGRLAGIYCVNWNVPAQRAVKLGKSWWTVIPAGEDAVLLLDPVNLTGGSRLMAYRRELDSNCGLLKGEKKFTASPTRLDAALLKAWASYQQLRTGQITKCPISGVGITSEFRRGIPVSNLVPAGLFCSSGGAAVTCPVNPIGRRCSFAEMWKLIVCYHLNKLPTVCPSCTKLTEVFTPELMIAIFWEETRFENIRQSLIKRGDNRGRAAGFGQVEPAEITKACNHCGITPPWKRDEIAPHVDDEKAVQIAGMSLGQLFCTRRKTLPVAEKKCAALLNYAGLLSPRPPSFKGTLEEWREQRRGIVDGWLNCEKHLLARFSGTPIDKRFLIDALNKASAGKPGQRFNAVVD